MTGRPNCSAPSAYLARGAGHCRACAARAQAIRRWADPAGREALRQRFVALNRDPAVRRRQVEGMQRNRAGMGAIRRAARSKLRAMNADSEVAARREAGKRAARPRILALWAARLAETLPIPVELVPEYRALRRRHKLTRAEALRVLRAGHPAAFAEIDAAQRAAALRAAGPAPAIGMPGRAAWTQAVNHAARLPAAPPA